MLDKSQKRMPDWLYDYMPLGIFTLILVEDASEFATARVHTISEWLAALSFVGAQMLAGWALAQFFGRKDEKIRMQEVRRAQAAVEEAAKRFIV